MFLHFLCSVNLSIEYIRRLTNQCIYRTFRSEVYSCFELWHCNLTPLAFKAQPRTFILPEYLAYLNASVNYEPIDILTKTLAENHEITCCLTHT